MQEIQDGPKLGGRKCCYLASLERLKQRWQAILPSASGVETYVLSWLMCFSRIHANIDIYSNRKNHVF